MRDGLPADSLPKIELRVRGLDAARDPHSCRHVSGPRAWSPRVVREQPRSTAPWASAWWPLCTRSGRVIGPAGTATSGDGEAGKAMVHSSGPRHGAVRARGPRSGSRAEAGAASNGEACRTPQSRSPWILPSNTAPAPQSKPVTLAPRLVARIAPSVASGLGLRILAAGPAAVTLLRLRMLMSTRPQGSAAVPCVARSFKAVGGWHAPVP